MGRIRERPEVKKIALLRYRDEMTATRKVSGGEVADSGEEWEVVDDVTEIMKCSFGNSTSGKTEMFYANGEAQSHGELLRITVEGSRRDIVFLMFTAAIARVGFAVVK